MSIARPRAFGATFTVARREFTGYFATPVAYVFIVIFLVLTGTLTFSLGGFFQRGQADLQPFFNFVPWLFLFLVPSLTMRLWAEERRLGTIELLLTLPMPQWQAVVGKFLAAWLFCAIALALTFPLVITVNILGRPDNGVILAGYAGCLLVAGAYLAIGAAISALTKNQVIAFVLTVAACFIFAAAGAPVVTDSDRRFFDSPAGASDFWFGKLCSAQKWQDQDRRSHRASGPLSEPESIARNCPHTERLDCCR